MVCAQGGPNELRADVAAKKLDGFAERKLDAAAAAAQCDGERVEVIHREGARTRAREEARVASK